MLLRRRDEKFMLPISLLRFLIVGMANTLVGLSVIWIAKEMVGVGDALANISGYVVGVTVSFVLNKRWSFSFRGDRGASLLRFLLVFAMAYSANLVSVLGAIALTGRDSFWFQVCGVLPYTTLFYLGCRFYAFPNSLAKSPQLSSTGG
jgi:putative flippase GtrA